MNIKASITIIHTICLLFCLNGCINEFIPEGVKEKRGFFVVDGTITNGESVFTLSRSIGISEKLTGEETVNNAIVTVESNDGASIPAHYKGDGKYVAQTGDLDKGLQYRLSIVVDGDAYRSGYLSPIKTAEIDSIFPIKKEQEKSVHICLSTHDPEGSSLYYRWSYNETWEVKAEYYANARWSLEGQDPGQIIFHSLGTSENTYYCWGRDFSKSLILCTTEKLSQNMISQQNIVEIPFTHDKLSILYHIDVQQMQIREACYQYLYDLQQNVERTGGLFSPVLTSGVRGNIQCLNDPERLVIGYVDVSTTTKKDLYIWGKEGFYSPPIIEQQCHRLGWNNNGFLYGLGIVEYLKTVERLFCVDCRMKEHASKNKPDGWPTEHL